MPSRPASPTFDVHFDDAAFDEDRRAPGDPRRLPGEAKRVGYTPMQGWFSR